MAVQFAGVFSRTRAILLLVGLLAVVVGFGGLVTAAPLAAGTQIPASDVNLKGVDDKVNSLAGLKGAKGTLVIFTCNHCPYVVAWEKRIAAIGNAYKDKGFGVVAINSNDPRVKEGDNLEGMKARARELALRFPYVVDEGSRVARAFGAERTPEVFLFDGEGKLVYHGAVDDNSEKAEEVKSHYLKDALEAVLAGRPVNVAETKAIGCSIKWYGD